MSSSFYGNIKNNSRASFIFDRIYCSRYEMEYNLSHVKDDNGEIQGDGVFINRYVLINYGYIDADSSTNSIKIGYSRIDPRYVQGSDETYNPALHIVNANNYTNFYIYSNNKYVKANTRYDRLHLDAGHYYYQRVNFCDRFDTTTYFGNSSTPGVSGIENSYFAGNRAKDANTYGSDYHLTVWMKIYTDNKERYILVGRLLAKAPALELCDAPPSLLVVPGTNTNDGTAWNLHAPFFDLIRSSDINYKYYMPKHWDVKLGTVDFNQAGFSATTRSYIEGAETTDNIVFKIGKSGYDYPKMIGLKIDLTPDTYVPNQYFLDSACTNLSTGDFSVGTDYYVKTLEYVDGVPQTIKAGDRKNLTITMKSIGNAVSEVYDSIYGIPKTGSTRPYTHQMLYRYSELSPYENLTDNDRVCVAWAMEQMKPYISELRYLSHGETNTNAAHPGIGLLSDWTLDDMDAFGYMYHKPRVLWTGGYASGAWTNPDGTSSDTHYMAAHTIEYIYDHYTTANTTLFGSNRNQSSWLNARH